MTKILLLLGVLLASQSWANNTPTATFGWDAVDPTVDLAFQGYRIYRTTTSGQYVFGATSSNLVGTIPSGNQSYQVTGIPATGTFYFVVTAYDSNGFEGAASNEVLLPQLPIAPIGFKVTGP